MVGGFLWFQGTFAQFLVVSGNLCPVFGSIQVLGKDIHPGFLEVRLAEVKKNKKNDRNGFFDRSFLLR